jgi:flagellar motor protein MotB
MTSRPFPVAAALAGVVLAVVGCAQNPFRASPPAGTAAIPPASGLARPALVAPPPSYADVDAARLDGTLTRSRQESQLMQTEIAALRDQLASTSAQLAQARAAGMPPARPASETDHPVTSPETMRSAATQLALPDLQPRFDGAVVRIDIPADRMFEAGTANLLPAGTATLTKVAEEIDRVFPGHYVGIEGHTDTEPLVNVSWGSPHQLTTARAAAVFDFLTSRTRVREGQLFIVAHGSNHPLVSNATPAGRARNRRVELVVYAERAAGAP